MDQKERDEKVAELKRRGVQPEEVCHLTDEVAEKCRRQDPEIEALLDQLSEEQNHASSGGGKIVDQKRSDRRTAEELTRLYGEPEITSCRMGDFKDDPPLLDEEQERLLDQEIEEDRKREQPKP